jgi:dynein heavy chain, axonemal
MVLCDMPEPVQLVDDLFCLQVMLPKLAFDVFTEFISDVRNSASVLTTPDSEVVKFVEKMAFLKSLKSKEAKLDAQWQEVKQLYELIESAGIPVADFEAAELATLDSDFDSLKNAIEEVEGAREENTTTFVAGLSCDWEELEKNVIEVRNAAQHEKILDKDADHDDVVTYLSNLKGKIEVLAAEEDRINTLRKEFNETPIASKDMAATAEEVELKLALWQTSANFAVTCNSWSSTPIAELDLKALEEEVQIHHKLCTKIERNLPPNSKAPELRDLVAHQRNLLPIVTALSNKSMRERHWKKMAEAMGVPMPPFSDPSFTMEFLTDLKIGKYKDTVLAISTEATQEAALEEMLAKVNSKWSDIEFQCIPYKDSKDMVILSAVDEITATLEDSMVTMSTIVSSRCAIHKFILHCGGVQYLGIHVPMQSMLRILPELKVVIDDCSVSRTPEDSCLEHVPLLVDGSQPYSVPLSQASDVCHLNAPPAVVDVQIRWRHQI